MENFIIGMQPFLGKIPLNGLKELDSCGSKMVISIFPSFTILLKSEIIGTEFLLSRMILGIVTLILKVLVIVLWISILIFGVPLPLFMLEKLIYALPNDLNSLDKRKSPGPDGLNSDFYVFYWDVIKDLLFKAISHFFQTATLPKSWGRTYVALIPKNDNPSCVKDFKPDSLCNTCCKIISKILANRLKSYS